MGTRGHLGGLAEATLQALLLLDAAGKDVVFLETVGTGQSEVEVIGVADTVVLVLMPGSGDSMQALKAGIMEIPDVIAINKRDHPAAQTMLNEVRSILALDRERDVEAADRADGGARAARTSTELWERDRASTARTSRQTGGLEERRRRQPRRRGVRGRLARGRRRTSSTPSRDDPELRRLLDEVQRRELDPLTAVREILEKVFQDWRRRTAPDTR